MLKGLLGKKIGMTRVFDAEGKRISVTLLEAGPCVVQAVKTAEKDGYNAVRLGFEDIKEKKLRKPQRDFYKKSGLECKYFARELRYENAPDVKMGDEIKVSIFQDGDHLDVVGISKGKGYQGGIKRCNWVGGPGSHGSMSHRAPGSIGASSFPSRVHKGHSFPGHMGSDRVTVQNLEVISVNAENNTIALKGAVPGANGGYLIIKFAKKKPIAARKK